MSKLIATVVLSMIAGSAVAAGRWTATEHYWSMNDKVAATAVSAPEIDPASSLTGLTLLAGGLAVLRGRRNRK
jgi:hypothetical protein